MFSPDFPHPFEICTQFRSDLLKSYHYLIPWCGLLTFCEIHWPFFVVIFLVCLKVGLRTFVGQANTCRLTPLPTPPHTCHLATKPPQGVAAFYILHCVLISKILLIFFSHACDNINQISYCSVLLSLIMVLVLFHFFHFLLIPILFRWTMSSD